jgi:hypothetical protein
MLCPCPHDRFDPIASVLVFAFRISPEPTTALLASKFHRSTTRRKGSQDGCATWCMDFGHTRGNFALFAARDQPVGRGIPAGRCEREALLEWACHWSKCPFLCRIRAAGDESVKTRKNFSVGFCRFWNGWATYGQEATTPCNTYC